MTAQDGVDVIKPFRNFLLHWLNETRGREVTAVQVGANDGAMADPLAPVLTRFGWRGLLIEPVPRYFAALSARYADNDRVATRNLAIAATAGTATIHHLAEAHEAAYPGWARGLASFEEAHLHRAIRPEHLTSIEVPCQPLAEILDREGIAAAQVLVVDVEGAEKLVFSSFEWSRLRPLMIEVETRHLPPEEKDWLFARLHKGGFDVFDFGFDTIAVRRGWLKPSLRLLIRMTPLEAFKVEPGGRG